MRKIIHFYENLVKILFFIYLAGMLSLGRAFAIIEIIRIGPVPLYVTELILLIAAPLVLLRRKKIFELPKKFLIPLAAFFIIGIIYLAAGILKGNLYSLRDIVFCGYILFLPITLITFSGKKDMIVFLSILFVCNLIGLFFGKISMCAVTFNNISAAHFTRTLRTFNLGLYYGITVSFMIAFFSFLKKKWHKFLVLFLVSLNVYISTFFQTRALSVAGLALIIFFLIVFWRRFLKFSLFLIPIIIIVFGIFSYYDSGSRNRLDDRYVSTKGDMKTLIKEDIISQGATAFRDAPGSVWEEPYQTTPDGIPVHDLPSRKLQRKDNLVWRLDIWYQAIHFGLKSPIFGRGFGVYPQYLVWFLVKPPPQGIGAVSRTVPAHNHLISIFYKMGFLGLGLFLFINGYVFLYGLRYIKKCKINFTRCFLIGSLGAFVFWHASALFFDIINSPPTSMFLWVIIGLIFSTIEVEKRSNDEKYL